MKQNSFKTVPITTGICCLCKTAVYNAVNQALVNEHGDNMRYSFGKK